MKHDIFIQKRAILVFSALAVLVIFITYFWRLSFHWPDTERCTEGLCLRCLGFSTKKELYNGIIVHSCYGVFVNFSNTRAGRISFPTKFTLGYGYCRGITTETVGTYGRKGLGCYGFYNPTRASMDRIDMLPEHILNSSPELPTPTLIDKDYRDSKITLEQKWLYMMYAFHDYEKLPSKYKSTVGWSGTMYLSEFDDLVVNGEVCNFSNEVIKELEIGFSRYLGCK